MTRWVTISNRTRGGAMLARARWCEDFRCRLRGLMLRRRLAPGEGLLLVERAEGRLSAAIHMWLVAFSIGVAWLDGEQRVVDCRMAQPWRIYLPHAPARYILEAEPGLLERVAVGDQLAFSDEANR